MIETHPYGNFVPQNARYLILGSFPGKRSGDTLNNFDWFFSSKRNLFWPILQEVYGVKLQTIQEKLNFCKTLELALADIILTCERRLNSNLDTNLTNIVFNLKLWSILQNNNIIKIFFTSRFVEKLFRKHFKDLISKQPEIELITLPSPSPRFAAMSKAQKVVLYKQLLPKL